MSEKMHTVYYQEYAVKWSTTGAELVWDDGDHTGLGGYHGLNVQKDKFLRALWSVPGVDSVMDLGSGSYRVDARFDPETIDFVELVTEIVGVTEVKPINGQPAYGWCRCCWKAIFAWGQIEGNTVQDVPVEKRFVHSWCIARHELHAQGITNSRCREFGKQGFNPVKAKVENLQKSLI